MKKIKICLAATIGGHFEQIIKLLKLDDTYNIILFTNSNKVSKTLQFKNIYRVYSPNMKGGITKFFGFVLNGIESFFYLLFKRPKVIVSTGSGEMYPLLWLGKKIFHKKVIFIESFAKVKTPNLCGKAVYKFADLFIVQWKPLLNAYPNAIYLGGIY